MDNIYTVDEAAYMLGLDPSQVRRLLRSGELKGTKFGRDWMVTSLDYKRKRKQGGGRKKGNTNEKTDVT